jgi:hypothetical protein
MAMVTPGTSAGRDRNRPQPRAATELLAALGDVHMRRADHRSCAVETLDALVRRDLRVTGPARPAGAAQCGGLRAKPVVIGLLCAHASHRRIFVAAGLAEREGFELMV